MRALAPIVAAALTATSTAAAADTALIDSVETYGGVNPDAAGAHLTRSLIAAGYAVQPAEPGATPCGPDLTCARQRIRATGVDLAIRAAYVELAGQITVSLQLVGAGGAPREVSATVTDLEVLEPDLVGALRPPAPIDTGDERRELGWWLAGSGIALAAGGAAAMLVARSQRNSFFANFVDENGDVAGLTPAEARRREDRANRWLVTGYVLAGAGVVAGAASVIWFATGEPGVAVKGSF